MPVLPPEERRIQGQKQQELRLQSRPRVRRSVRGACLLLGQRGLSLPPHAPAGGVLTAADALGGSGGSDLFFGDTSLADLLGLGAADAGGAPMRESSSAAAAAAAGRTAGPLGTGGAATEGSSWRPSTASGFSQNDASLGEVSRSVNGHLPARSIRLNNCHDPI